MKKPIMVVAALLLGLGLTGCGNRQQTSTPAKHQASNSQVAKKSFKSIVNIK